jgi:hypothetical protein
MVLAVRRRQPLPAAQQQALRAQVAELKAFYGVQAQTLERLLAEDAAAGTPGEALATA